MSKSKEATARLFTNMFICRKCKAKLRTSSLRVRTGKVKCRKCQSKALRPKHKESKGGGGTATTAAPTKK